MRLNRPNSLGKTIEARASNRPVKIAYLVPFDEATITHMILDAVFFESYTRWGGAYTLIVPTKEHEFESADYERWLQHYDPDFIYSYVELDAALIEKIDYLSCPITFLKHNIHPQEGPIRWRSLLPDFKNYIQPVSSISTIHSFTSYSRFARRETAQVPTVFTQYETSPDNRFLADNFGTGFHIHRTNNAVPGFFKTLCLTSPDLPGYINAGTERCHSVLEAFCAISDRKAIPIANFTLSNTELPLPRSMIWSSAFQLFVGNTPLDRIHFWNSRHLGSHWNDTLNALILSPTFFNDEEFIKQLGQYLNKNNFLGNRSGTFHVELRSHSIKQDGLNGIKDKLQPHTQNNIQVSALSNSPPVPSKREFEEYLHTELPDTATLRLTEDLSDITPSEPTHFIFIPPQFKGYAQGQWIVELDIQRHNNLSPYANVVENWILPRCRHITSAFTANPAKSTLYGRLALLPWDDNAVRGMSAIKNQRSYDIRLPSDETFFRHLVLDRFKYKSDDLRTLVQKTRYSDFAISDKGQNFRGVISLFGHLHTAYKVLTNKFFRTVLTRANKNTVSPLTFNKNKLLGILPNDRKTMNRLQDELHLGGVISPLRYLQESLIDTLEYLVRSNVFYQVANWRCDYCGHQNSRSFDNLKIKNACDICATEYFAPIDIEWQYELSDFVYRSLQQHSGLPVLWALGILQEKSHRSFWYLPEIDLYEEDNSQSEIDILCMSDGKFCAVEVKLSASTFLNKDGEVDKFVNKIERLRPSVAILAFEQYGIEGEDMDVLKERLHRIADDIRKRIGPYTKLMILVAQDNANFNDFSADLGWPYGPRVYALETKLNF